MNEMIRDTYFRLYEVREDGEGIDFTLYMVNLDAKDDCTIDNREKHVTGQDVDFEKVSIDQNSKEVKAVMEARSKYRGLKTKMPDSTKVQRRLQALENIYWHFFEWFQENGVDIDSIESFIQNNSLPSKFQWKDCKIIIYKNYQISFISPNISDLTPKDPSSVGLYSKGSYSAVFETIIWFAQHGNPFNPALVIDGNPEEFNIGKISSRIRRLNSYLKEHFGLNNDPILRYSRAKVGYLSKLDIRFAFKLKESSEMYVDSEDALSKANFDEFHEDPLQAHLRNKSR